ncbi:MAG: hypothetical protein WCD69_25720, partial [Xanthobacteraceae bacterium]
HIAGLLQALTECGRHGPEFVRRLDVEEPNKRHIWLLRMRDPRPRHCRANKNCDEFPSPHGFARAKDHIGYEKNITFLIAKLCCALRPTVAAMSALASRHDPFMSALPPKADIRQRSDLISFKSSMVNSSPAVFERCAINEIGL